MSKIRLVTAYNTSTCNSNSVVMTAAVSSNLCDNATPLQSCSALETTTNAFSTTTCVSKVDIYSAANGPFGSTIPYLQLQQSTNLKCNPTSNDLMLVVNYAINNECITLTSNTNYGKSLKVFCLCLNMKNLKKIFRYVSIVTIQVSVFQHTLWKSALVLNPMKSYQKVY
jgi:hypothetical protein